MKQFIGAMIAIMLFNADPFVLLVSMFLIGKFISIMQKNKQNYETSIRDWKSLRYKNR